MRVVDLFCGCGGLSLGFVKAGMEIVAAFDNWTDALAVYRNNLFCLFSLFYFKFLKFSAKNKLFCVLLNKWKCIMRAGHTNKFYGGLSL